MTGLAESHRKLVTVITEANLERDLVRELDALGVAGYTVSDARGRGDKGLRASHWGHSSNIRVEIGRASCRERVSEPCRSRWSPYH